MLNTYNKEKKMNPVTIVIEGCKYSNQWLCYMNDHDKGLAFLFLATVYATGILIFFRGR